MMEDTRYTVRKLQAKDTFTLAVKFERWAGDLKPLLEQISAVQAGRRNESEDTDARAMELGVSLFGFLMGRIDDIKPWLADLAGMTPEELDEADFDAPIVILEQAFDINKDNLLNFFNAVLRLKDSVSLKFLTQSVNATVGQTNGSNNSRGRGSGKS